MNGVAGARESARPLAQADFDLRGELPRGVTVLEASAGTGKTYTIAALTARYVAAGVPLESLLLVTFTRMATGELRDRVRERLVSAERELSRVLAGAQPAPGDEVAELLAEGGPVAVKHRRDRLAAAVSGFDAATIATTHGFCQEVLDELGTLGDLEPDITFLENVDDLIEEVIDDLYVRRFHKLGDAALSRSEAGRVARIAIASPGAVLHPRDPEPGSLGAMRRRLAERACEELAARKRSLALMTYDDLLTRLRDTLRGSRGAAAAAKLRARYRVVLIDEFQDTDPIQWEIVQRAFGEDDVTLVLIADPKQAIYAFRGADVYAYLAAVRAASRRATLRTNRRSDQALIDGFDALFGHARLGHPDIAYRRVQAAPSHRQPRLHGAPVPAALRVRVVDRLQTSISLTYNGFASAPSAREHIARDLADQVVALLSSEAWIDQRSQGRETIGTKPVAPGDLAVLVQSHRNAALVKDELDAAGVPAVINGAGSVFATAGGADWLTLLEALERPASPPRARAAALTPFLGWSAERLARAETQEDELEELHQRLHRWARVLRARGMAALTETIMVGEHVPGGVLSFSEGERELTDLRHVGELLHGAASKEGLGVSALAAWLRQRIAAAGREGVGDELTRRLESDADAVQVLTIHRSKGLEFPIVFCPFLWEPGWIPRGLWPVAFHDPDSGDARAIDVGLEGSGYDEHCRQHVREERGEDLRLAYVALTRARHQAVVWWAGSKDSRDSPLGRLLFSQDADGNIASAGTSTPSDEAAFARFSAVRERASTAVSVEWSRLGLASTWGGPPPEAGDLAVAHFDRRLDSAWRRTSYSAITAAAHEAWVDSEPEEPVLRDEPAGPVAAAATIGGGDEASTAELTAVALPLAEMAAGAHVGTLVHRVLEAVDFTAPDLAGELVRAIDGGRERGRLDLGCEVAAVAAGLQSALETPLGGELGELALRDLARGDRLDELEFELPLAGGDTPTGRVALASVAQLLRQWLAPGDPLAGYADRLEDPMLAGSLRGYLTGSIDLVLRTPAGTGRPARFAIIDYKTNWLAAAGEPLSGWHYRPAALGAEMQRSHYGLQALLYTVALHRFLRWRLAGYDPSANLAGVHYLFLRGMLGAGTPRVDGGRCGVFVWQPPAGLVLALSDVLDRGAVAA